MPVTWKIFFVWSTPISVKRNGLTSRQEYSLLKKLFYLIWKVKLAINSRLSFPGLVWNSINHREGHCWVVGKHCHVAVRPDLKDSSFTRNAGISMKNISLKFLFLSKKAPDEQYIQNLYSQGSAAIWKTWSWQFHKLVGNSHHYDTGSYFHFKSFTLDAHQIDKDQFYREVSPGLCLTGNRARERLKLPVWLQRSSDTHPVGLLVCPYLVCPCCTGPSPGAAWSAEEPGESCTYLVPDPAAVHVPVLGCVHLAGLFWKHQFWAHLEAYHRGEQSGGEWMGKRPNPGVLDQDCRQEFR